MEVSEQKWNISLQNHVKELSNTTQNTTNFGFDEKNSLGSSRRKRSKKKKNLKNKRNLEKYQHLVKVITIIILLQK